MVLHSHPSLARPAYFASYLKPTPLINVCVTYKWRESVSKDTTGLNSMKSLQNVGAFHEGLEIVWWWPFGT